jgi:hypothetical protein
MRAWLLVAGSVVIWSHSVAAQASPTPAGPRLVATWSDSWEPASLAASTRLATAGARALGREAKWALGGAIVAGTLSAAVANALCERSDCTGPTLQWAVIGAGTGAALGALIAKATE